MSTDRIKQAIRESLEVKQSILADESMVSRIEEAARIMAGCFRDGGKTLFCGNGGSAADAQHLAAELSGRYYMNRPPLFAEALHVNTSYLTATANDYGYSEVFSRMVQAKGRAGDVLVCISTSGNSDTVILAAETGRKIGMRVIGMTGRDGGWLKDHSDILLNVPSEDTPRVQEAHILMGHIICELVESTLFAG